jgi:hypothetical protein
MKKQAKPLAIIIRIILAVAILAMAVDYVRRHMPQMMKDITVDVSQRLMSPDGTRVAYLLRRYAFDLNFGVVVKPWSDIFTSLHYDPRSVRTVDMLFLSPDFYPDPTFSWNERLEWSADSSVLLLTINNREGGAPFMWAYDFNAQKEIVEVDEIKATWSRRK